MSAHPTSLHGVSKFVALVGLETLAWGPRSEWTLEVWFNEPTEPPGLCGYRRVGGKEPLRDAEDVLIYVLCWTSEPFPPIVVIIMVVHSPPSTRSRTDQLEARLREQMKNYRRLLQKVAKVKTKLLCALRDADCREAAELLQTPPCEAGAGRCSDCQGCETLHGFGPCGSCPGCVAKGDCVEHSRLCFKWKQPATTFVAGSVVTGISSACYLPDYDLTSYREMVDKLGDVSLDIESTLDEFPAGADPRQNERFSSERRDRDVVNEEEQLTVLSTLVLRTRNTARGCTKWTPTMTDRLMMPWTWTPWSLPRSGSRHTPIPTTRSTADPTQVQEYSWTTSKRILGRTGKWTAL